MDVRRDRRFALGLALGCTFIYAASGGGRFFSVDEVAAYHLTRMWVDDIPIAPSTVTWRGPDGRSWNLQGPMLSVLGIPGYALGKLLEGSLPEAWHAHLAGPVLGDPRGVQWGGTMTIFGTSFTNAWITGVIVALVFLWSRQLGARPRPALITALVTATGTLLFAHSKNFFSHSAVTLFLLVSVMALHRARLCAWRDAPTARWLSMAGAAAACMVLTRVQSSVMLPALALYAAWLSPGTLLARVRGSLAFVIPAALGVVCFAGWNLYRFGTLTEAGYTHFDSFTFPWYESFYGHLLSVGRSVFLYSPPLVLAVWGFRASRLRAEAWLVFGVAGSLLLLYASWSAWHGAWCFGNRYLLPWVPVLMGGLGLALQSGAHRTRRYVALGGLWAVGLGVQVLGLAVHIAFIHHAYHFAEHPAPLPYLFVPTQSQLAAHADALLKGDAIDPWLLRAVSDGGLFAASLMVLCAGLAAALLIARPPRDARARAPG